MARRGEFRRVRTELIRYGRPHRRVLWAGMAGAVGVVACRLAIPWPLRWALEAVRGEPAVQTPAVQTGWLFGDPILTAAVVYAIAAIAFGIFDFILRTRVGRFTSLVVGDLRLAAASGLARREIADHAELGELAARLTGDSARARSDIAGILVTASTNGLLFLAVTAVMLAVSPPLGLIFFSSGAIVLAIGARTSPVVAATARRQRVKEGDFANRLHAWLDGSEPKLKTVGKRDAASGRKEMRLTHIIGQSSALLHAILGAGVGLGLWIGSREIRAGAMAPGDMFLFVAYALTVHRRLIQVGRQVARTGKVVASIDRLTAMVPDEREERPESAAPALELRIVKAKLKGGRGRRERLRRVDLSLPPGSRVAVLGPAGAGKSTLLRVLAGRQPGARGAVYWGTEPFSGDLADRVGFFGDTPGFPRQALTKLLGLGNKDTPSGSKEMTLRDVGAWPVVQGFKEGPNARVASLDLSPNEVRAVTLARFLKCDRSPIWVLDQPLDGASVRKAKRRLDEILECAAGRAVVVSMSRAVGLSRFDRVLVLRRGRIVFDGPPSDRKRRNMAA